MLYDEKTIAAVATPEGKGGIGIIRISGKKAISIADRVFSGKRPLVTLASYSAEFGTIRDPSNTVIDEVICLVMKAPRTYTCEDVVEINAHGGDFVLRKILSLLVEQGARPAYPGEFTLRAFLNGRIDLTRAEAVADLINADSEASHRAAVEQISGTLKKKIQSLCDQVLKIRSDLELEIDFIEEMIEITNKQDAAEELVHIAESCRELLESYEDGRILSEGIRVVICGRTNVGKSSIFNRLVKQERVIVTDTPGTTRDIVRVAMKIKGNTVSFSDTAGIFDTAELIDKKSIEMAREEISRADIVLFVRDTGGDISQDRILAGEIRSLHVGPLVYVLNKIDLVKSRNRKQLARLDKNELFCSAKTGENSELLEKTIGRIVDRRIREIHSASVITNVRHRDILASVVTGLEKSVSGLKSGLDNEYVAVDLDEVMEKFKEFTGEAVSGLILKNIFSRFCIGK